MFTCVHFSSTLNVPLDINVLACVAIKYTKSTLPFGNTKQFPGNKQTGPLIKHTCSARDSVVEVAKNIKRRGGGRHRVFGQLNISIFNFSLGAERRGAVGGQPVADDR